MGWKELFADHGVAGYERTKVDNNSSVWKSKYSKGWSSTSSWTSKIPGFSGFSYTENSTKKDNTIDALVAALPVLCNSIGLFEPNMKIQWADRDVNNFHVGTNVVLLSPDLIVNNIKDSSKISQAYDALIGDAIMAGHFSSRVRSMENANDYKDIVLMVSGSNDANSQSQQCEYIFSSKSLKVSGNSAWNRRGKKTRHSLTFNVPFKSKFGRLFKFTLPYTLNQSAMQMALACEQKLAEKNVCEKYKGANSYIFASRQISSTDEVRNFLRTSIAKVRPFSVEERTANQNYRNTPHGFSEMIASVIIWNIINPDDKIYGPKYSSAIINMVEKNLLPSTSDLPDIVLAKCVYILNFIKEIVEDNPESYEDEGQGEDDEQGQEEGQDEGQGQGEGEDDENGEDEGEEGEGEGEDEGQGEGEGEGEGEGQGQGDLSQYCEVGRCQGEEESDEEGQGEGEYRGQEEGEGDDESRSSYSHDDFDNSKAWNGNVRNVKMPLQLKDALEDIKTNKVSLDGNSVHGALAKYKNGILSSSFRIRVSEIKTDLHSEQTPAFSKPLDISDTRSIRLLQFNKADSSRPVKIIDYGKIDSKMAYAKVESNYRRFIDSIRERLKVRSMGYKAEEHCKSSGNLDEGNVWQLYDTNYDQIFYSESQPKILDKAHISVLIDASGSMSDNLRIEMVRDMGVILSSALSEIWGVEFKLYGHCHGAIYDVNNGDFNTTKDIMLLSPDGGTDEGGAIQYVLRDSYKHKIANYDCNSEKINHYLIAIGDGQSNVLEIQSAVKIADEIGIKFCHIGVDNAYTEDYGNKCYGSGKFAILPKESVIQSMVTIVTRILS